MHINITNIIRKIIDVSYCFRIIFLWFYSAQNTEWFQNSKHINFETINIIITMKDITCTSFWCVFVFWFFFVLFWLVWVFFGLTSMPLLVYLSYCQSLLQRVHSLNFKAQMCSK